MINKKKSCQQQGTGLRLWFYITQIRKNRQNIPIGGLEILDHVILCIRAPHVSCFAYLAFPSSNIEGITSKP
jgi:hypothetical protein